MAAQQVQTPYVWGRLVTECERRGIGKNVAFKLAREKKIDTFRIGKYRMVMIASLDSLPDRLAEAEMAALK